ncbi:DNA/RNA non-specific endonuclease [Promicromonospora soli]
MAQSDLQRIAADLVAYFEGVTGEIGVLVEIHNATTRNANLLGVLSHRATGDTRSYVGAAAVELAEASKAVRRAAELLEDSSGIALGWARQAVLDTARTGAGDGATSARGEGAVLPGTEGSGGVGPQPGDRSQNLSAPSSPAAAPQGPAVKPPPQDADGSVRLSTSDPEHQQWLQKPPGDATIVVDDTFTYLTDTTGRVITAKATLVNVDPKHPRSGSSQRKLPDRQAGDHAGHIFARIFKGPGELVNLVPMVGSEVNLSVYKILENRWKKAIKEDAKTVRVEVRLTYRSAARRPDALFVDYWLDDEKADPTVIHNRPRRRRGTPDGTS